MKPAEYLTYYASKFYTVEIDNTYYGPPSASTVTDWRDKTPANFAFAAKVLHGIWVVIRDIPDQLTGDLDGAQIHIDNAVTPEQRLFLLAHWLICSAIPFSADRRAYSGVVWRLAERSSLIWRMSSHLSMARYF